MPEVPNRVLPGSKFGDAWNKSRELARSHQPLQTVGLRTAHTVHGVHREPARVAPPYDSGDATPFRKFALTAEEGDYLVCKTLEIAEDGEWTLGTEDVYIAKPPELRHSLTGDTIESQVITYSYAQNAEGTYVRTQTNTSADPEEVQDDVVTPYYILRDTEADPEIPGSLIMAAPVAGGTGVWRTVSEEVPGESEAVTEQLTLQEFSSRAWTAI